jgi:hypothetical protein
VTRADVSVVLVVVDHCTCVKANKAALVIGSESSHDTMAWSSSSSSFRCQGRVESMRNTRNRPTSSRALLLFYNCHCRGGVAGSPPRPTALAIVERGLVLVVAVGSPSLCLPQAKCNYGKSPRVEIVCAVDEEGSGLDQRSLVMRRRVTRANPRRINDHSLSFLARL